MIMRNIPVEGETAPLNIDIADRADLKGEIVAAREFNVNSTVGLELRFAGGRIARFAVGGCGCCGSPWKVDDVLDEAFNTDGQRAAFRTAMEDK